MVIQAVISMPSMNFSWKLNSEIIGITALVVGDAAAFWSANNPSVFTVRAFRRKGGKEAEQTKRDIRLGGLAGSGLALIVGFGGSLVTQSWWPIAGAAGILAFEWVLWEWAIRNPHGSGGDIADGSPANGGTNSTVPGLGFVTN